MEAAQLHEIYQKQKTFFENGHTRSFAFRKEQLQKLYHSLIKFEGEIVEAMKLDLGKGEFEAYLTEIAVVKAEIKFAIRNLRRWMRPKRLPFNINAFPSRNFILSEPYGQILIISPWNYPLNLLVTPLIGSIAAGNCAILKPSEFAPNVSGLVRRMINDTFDPEFVNVVEGGIEPTQELLKLPFDYIFYTGSTHVGRIVMKAAAENLTPVTLELGGKSPAIVDETARLDVSARRLIWGKFLNTGQTCLAPDYILAQEDIVEELIENLKTQIEKAFGSDPQKSLDYGRIVDHRHFDRLVSMYQDDEVLTGGNTDRDDRYIAPTLVRVHSLDHPLMQDEIFGPIMPILSYRTEEEMDSVIRSLERPLAFYLFTRKNAKKESYIRKYHFGGGCINDCILHFADMNMPFGGIGQSGMGAYHGKYSYETFSHKKGIVRKPFALDIPLRYAPYKGKLGLIRKILG
jgi:aldehyde dehydrogenase (NAD+)